MLFEMCNGLHPDEVVNDVRVVIGKCMGDGTFLELRKIYQIGCVAANVGLNNWISMLRMVRISVGFNMLLCFVAVRFARSSCLLSRHDDVVCVVPCQYPIVCLRCYPPHKQKQN